MGVFLRPSWGPVPLLAPLSLFGCLFACSWFGPCFPCRRFVFGFVFRFLSCLAPLCGVFVVLVFLPAFLRVSFLWPLCASLGVVGLLCVCPFLGCCRLPPRLLLPPSPLWLVPCGVLAQFLCWSLPLGIWLLLRRPGCLALMTSSCLMAAKAFGPVWGLYYPLHHVACVVAVLCTPTQRYSSADDPGPHWTPLSYTVAILGNKCGILRSCPLLLPSRRPLFLLLVWLWLCSLVFGAFLLFIQSPLPSLRREKSGAQMFARVS